MNAAELTLPMMMTGREEPEPANPELVQLVTLARTGDRAAFGRLIEDHLTAARRLALAAVGQPMDADEAVQEASVAAWTRLDALQDPAAFRGWFMRIVWRKAIDRRRSLRSWLDRFGGSTSSEDDRPFEFAAADPSPDAQLITRELGQAIAHVVRSLPRKLRDPFLMAASGDHRYEEIALVLDIPVGTVKWRISEARRLIRLKLDTKIRCPARIVASLPEQRRWLGWRYAAAAMVTVAALAVVVLRPFNDGSTAVLRSRDVSIVAELRTPITRTIIEPSSNLRRTFAEPSSNDRGTDHERSLPGLSVGSLAINAVATASLPGEASLNLPSLQIADLPLTTESFPQK